MIRTLVPSESTFLTTESQLFDFSNPQQNPIDLYKDLGETMISMKGLGLAAPQIGVPIKAFVMTAEEVIGVFNPRIVDYSQEMIVLEEGCLSFPNLFVKVKRPKKIRARYALPTGEIVTKVYDGMAARIFQHEYDHLEGMVFMKRANPYHMEKAKLLQKQLNRRAKNAKR